MNCKNCKVEIYTLNGKVWRHYPTGETDCKTYPKAEPEVEVKR